MNPILMATSITPDTGVEFTSTVVISGIGIVVLILVILIIVFQLFGAGVSKSEVAAKKRKAKKLEKQMEADAAQSSDAASSPAPAAVCAPAVQNGISGEIVAAISAAVYALEGEGASVTSITTVASAAATVPAMRNNPITVRNPWAQAAVTENIRPF